MPDKVGLLITTTPGDWIDYVDAFTNVWVKKLGHPNNSIMRGPPGGAKGKLQEIVQAAQAFEANGDVKVVVTAGTGAAQACQRELTKPFVYAAVGDPGLSGLIPQAGDNFTGGNNRQADEAVVKARVDWMLKNGFEEPFVVLGNNQNGQEPFQTAMTRAFNYLTSLSQVVRSQTITQEDDIPTVIAGFKAESPPVKSIYVCSDPYLTVNSKLLNDKAHDTTHGSPYINTMFEIKEHKNKHGGDAWFGSDFEELFGRAAHYAHEIILATSTPDKLPIYIASLTGGGAAHTSKKGRKKKSTTKKK
jgi:hypothetical protein